MIQSKTLSFLSASEQKYFRFPVRGLCTCGDYFTKKGLKSHSFFSICRGDSGTLFQMGFCNLYRFRLPVEFFAACRELCIKFAAAIAFARRPHFAYLARCAGIIEGAICPLAEFARAVGIASVAGICARACAPIGGVRL
ncbi:MAG: hypothetical protein DBX55_00750 [Verrucomicrobia bacterium]|nr:MAG: hypothetical protein DBX55_00750 [Verrucomicrobiota bacterium]